MITCDEYTGKTNPTEIQLSMPHANMEMFKSIVFEISLKIMELARLQGSDEKYFSENGKGLLPLPGFSGFLLRVFSVLK